MAERQLERQWFAADHCLFLLSLNCGGSIISDRARKPLWRFANAFTGRQAVRYGERQRAGASIKRSTDQCSRSLTLPVPYRRSRPFPVYAIAIRSKKNLEEDPECQT